MWHKKEAFGRIPPKWKDKQTKALFLEIAKKVFVVMMQWIAQAVNAVIISEKRK